MTNNTATKANARQVLFPPHAPYLVILNDHLLYSPNLVIIHGEKAGLVPVDTDEEILNNARGLLREFFLVQMKARRFPPGGDGFLPDHPNVRAWWGMRWKSLLNISSLKALRRKYKHLLPNYHTTPKDPAKAMR